MGAGTMGGDIAAWCALKGFTVTLHDFGMPMGPIALDICLSVANSVAQYVSFDVLQPLQAMVVAGKLGKKSGCGFYRPRGGGGKPLMNKRKQTFILEDIQWRLIGRRVNESVACLRENIIADDRLLDAGMIFGAGFVPCNMFIRMVLKNLRIV